MGQITNGKAEKEVKNEEDEEEEEEEEQEEQDGLSVHSPCKIPVSALRKENSEVELELRLLEALEIYPPAKLRDNRLNYKNQRFANIFGQLGSLHLQNIIAAEDSFKDCIHRHFVLYGLTEHMRRSFNRPFTADDVLKLLDRFYNLEMVKPDDEDAEFLSQEEDFQLPQIYFEKEES